MILKTVLAVFLFVWVFAGVWFALKFGSLFSSEDATNADTAGSRSLSMAHFASMWFGVFALTVYFLFR